MFKCGELIDTFDGNYQADKSYPCGSVAGMLIPTI